ncbi:MAG: hypothetical protein BMS9Abin04_043 [Planctomycetia bacterium]|nr:MAG: hypothetical protein BMS9Abin04_043 [Planctomycetia bacterium]
MDDAIDRLLALRVADVMTREVVVVSEKSWLAEAAELFGQRNVSAAPVVNQAGQCIGILSVADFVKLDAPLGGEAEPVPDENGRPAGDVAEPEWPSRQTVGSRMTRDVQSVESGASLLAAARVMCGQHIHRLPVLDEGRPVGVISTMDVVAALVNSIDEMKSSLDHGN